jgi:hypothetical protein
LLNDFLQAFINNLVLIGLRTTFLAKPFIILFYFCLLPCTRVTFAHIAFITKYPNVQIFSADYLTTRTNIRLISLLSLFRDHLSIFFRLNTIEKFFEIILKPFFTGQTRAESQAYDALLVNLLLAVEGYFYYFFNACIADVTSACRTSVEMVNLEVIRTMMAFNLSLCSKFLFQLMNLVQFL